MAEAVETVAALGFHLLATRGTVRFLAAHGVPSTYMPKVGEGTPDIGQAIRAGKVQMVINTPLGKQSRYDESAIRREARAAAVIRNLAIVAEQDIVAGAGLWRNASRAP